MNYEKYIEEFKDIAQDWFDEKGKNYWFHTRFKLFNEMFDKVKSQILTIEEINKILNELHSLKSIKLAQINAINEWTKEEKKEKFSESLRYLKYDNDPIEKRINELSNKKSVRYLNYIGSSTLSELVSYAFSNEYVFYNRRDIEAIEFLEIDIGIEHGDSFGKKFIKYNKAIQEILEYYKKTIHDKTDPSTSMSGTSFQLELDQFFSWIYSEKISSDKSEELKNEKKEKHEYIEEIEINGYYMIENVEIDFRNKDKEICKEVFFLGENGTGKTLILQSIVFGANPSYWLKNFQIQTDTGEEFDIKITTNKQKYKLFSYSSDPSKPREVNSYEIPNLFAYGVYRNFPADEKKNSNNIETLFSQNTKLINPKEWLERKNYEYLSLKENGKTNTFTGIIPDDAIRILQKLLNDEVKICKTELGKIEFLEKNTPIELSDFSDGYKITITWIADLLSRLADSQPDVKDTKDYIGIVLVDEIDLFLHPKWQYGIVEKLRALFPKIQFIYTTHSPIVLLGASEKAIIYKLYKEDNDDGVSVATVSEPYYKSEMSNLMTNAIITSPLFGLKSASMSFSDDLDKSENYYVSEIYKKIKQKVKDEESKGKVYISKEKINDLLNKIMSEVE